MAEIHVEPRGRGGLAWLWVLLIVIVVAALVWYFVLGAPGLAHAGTTAPATRPDTVSALVTATHALGLA